MKRAPFKPRTITLWGQAADRIESLEAELATLRATNAELVLQASKPSHEQAMRGYKVACKFGVLEGAAFRLVDEIYEAMRDIAAPAVDQVAPAQDQDNCSICGHQWDEHEFCVPAPYCP